MDEDTGPPESVFPATFFFADGYRLTLDVPVTASDQPSALLVGMKKGGSTLMAKIMRELSGHSPLTTFEYSREVFNRGIPENSIQRDPDRVLQRAGYVFGVFRWFPEADVFDLAALESGRRTLRTVLLLRDPRDALVSLYYSDGYSHFIPKAGPLNAEYRDRRERATSTSIDEYVLEQAPDFLRFYSRTLALKGLPGVETLRYEDIVYDKLTLVKAVARAMRAEPSMQDLVTIARRYDQIPGEEQRGNHVRQVHPGNYRSKLRQETITALDELFSPILAALDYATPSGRGRRHTPRAEADRVDAAPRTVLHVGLPATEPIVFQLAAQRSAGVRYIHSPHHGNPQSRQFANFVGVGEDALAAEDRAEWRSRFLSGYDTGTPVTVVSDETLSMVSWVDRDRLARLLDEIPGTIRIALVLRPFFSWIESLIGHFARNGNFDFKRVEIFRIDRLNRYTLSPEAVYRSYRQLAAACGERCEMCVLRYSDEILVDLKQLVGSPMPLAAEPAVNGSGAAAARDIMLGVLDREGLPRDILSETTSLRFLGLGEVAALHSRHKAGLDALSDELGWPRDFLDDRETFSTGLLEDSYLKIGKRILGNRPGTA